MTTPVLVFTDIGDDLDDHFALLYLAGNPQTRIAGVVTTGDNPESKAEIARELLRTIKVDAPVAAGSMPGNGRMLKTLVELASNAAATPNTCILAIGPLTDLATAYEAVPGLRALPLYLQGDVGSNFEPLSTSYNIRQDPAAAQLVLSKANRITCLSKHAAYEMPFTDGEFARLKSTGHFIGEQLATTALDYLKRFVEADIGTARRVFGAVNADLERLVADRKPFALAYDLLTAVTICNPGHFVYRTLSQHRVTGEPLIKPSIINVTATKEHALSSLENALH